MNLKLKLLALVVWGLLGSGMQPVGPPPQLIVEVHSIRTNAGTVRAFVFQSAEGFPSEGRRAVDHSTAPVHQGTALLRFTGLKPGQAYAISLFHDENDDRRMNKSWIGIPQEGYGASNDARVSMGPPRFEDARFVFRENGQKMRIQMRYF